MKGTGFVILTAGVMVTLGFNALWGGAAALDHWERRGIPRELPAACFLAGGLLMLWRRDAIMFVLATLPYCLFVAQTIYISLTNPQLVKTSAILIYGYSLVQMYFIYFGEEINGKSH